MDVVASLASSVAVTLSAFGLVSVVVSAIRQYRAERDLVRTMRRDEQARILGALEATRHELVDTQPDPEVIARAYMLLAMAAEELSDDHKQQILTILTRGSEKNRANYIVKLIDEFETQQAS